MDDDRAAWRQTLHTRMPVTSRALLAEAVRAATGHGAVEWERIVGGEMNEVYAVVVDSGSQAIVRVSRRADCRFESERWVLEQARGVGVVAPEMLLLDHTEDEHGALWLCVELRLPGISLDNISDPAVLEPLVVEAGEMIGQLHTLPVQGFGYLKPDGTGWLPTYTATMRSEQTEAELLCAEARAESLGIPRAWIRAASAELHRHDELFAATDAFLLHGDLGLMHLLTDGSKITGVLDFEDAQGGDPAGDLAWWNYFGEAAPLEWLVTGHERVNDFGPEFELRRRLARLRLHIGLADHFGKVGHRVGGQAVLAQLATDAAWFGFA